MPSQPHTFEHFEVARRAAERLDELRRGALGVTYKAFDTRLGSYVALKVINADGIRSEVGRVRFEREAKAAAHLNHPNVAAIFHRGQDGDAYFYAMQFIEGETFDAFVKRRGPLPPALALRLILQAAQGLAAASTRGLIHRDIKPANLMLVHPEDAPDPAGPGEAPDDDELLVKVIDFGLAKYLNKPGDTTDASLTGDRIVGTPYYMSPEQIDPVGKEIDARADIYSLGVTLWHLLSGKPPFLGTEFQVLNQHMNNSLPWERLPAAVPAAVHDLLERTMAKDPAARPASHRELIGLIKQQLRAMAVEDLSRAGMGALPTEPGQAPWQDVVEQSSSLPLPPADFSLGDVRERRGHLTTGEVLGLLSLLAPVVDAKREQESMSYDLQPGRIYVRFDAPPANSADLPAQPMDIWPPSQLELATLQPAASGHPAQPLAALAYELLTGRGASDPFEPVPGMNERGNLLLKQVFGGTDSFATATRFAEAFRLSLAGELHVPGTSGGPPVAASENWDSDVRDYSTGRLTTTPLRRKASRFPGRGVVLVALTLLAVAAGWWLSVHHLVPTARYDHATPHPVTAQNGGADIPAPGSIISAATRRYAPPPFFPPAAKAAHQQGRVLLDVDVDAAGNVTGATIRTSSGFPLLDEAAMQDVRAWKFEPARNNEVAVPSRTQEQVEFHAPVQ